MAAGEARVAKTLGPEALDALLALESESASPSWGRASLAAALDDPEVSVLGAERDGELIGHAILARLPFEAELQALLVAERHRRQGVAGQLMAAVIDRARAWGSERLLLEVRAGNGAAIALYRRLGFVEDGRRRGYYPPREAGAEREDAVLMSRPLV